MFTQEMILNIVVVLVIVGVIAGLWYSGNKKQALSIISSLVDAAEERFGSGTGDIKYIYVASHLYMALPSLARSIFTPNMIDNWIEEEVDKLQEKLKKKIESLS